MYSLAVTPVGSPRMMPTPSVPLSAPRPRSSSDSACAGAPTASATARARTKRMRQRSPALRCGANRSRLEQARELVAADPEQTRRGRLVAVAALEDRARVAPLRLGELEVVGQPDAVVGALG